MTARFRLTQTLSMELLPYVIAATAFAGVPSLLGIFALSLKKELLSRSLFAVVALGAGALLGNAFLHLLPEAAEGFGEAHLAGAWVLGGIGAFFLLEKVLRWHHHHTADEGDVEQHPHGAHPVGLLVIAADSLHNLIDGLAIAAAFSVSVPVGIATTVAILVHEIPQEISDFGLLLHSGYSRLEALTVNILSAVTAIIGGVIGLALVESVALAGPALLALTAGGFIYIATADLAPELHKTVSARKSLIQLAMIAVGVAVIALSTGGHG